MRVEFSRSKLKETGFLGAVHTHLLVKLHYPVTKLPLKLRLHDISLFIKGHFSK